MFKRYFLITLLSLFLIPATQASEPIANAIEKFESFKKGPDYTFAPATTAKAQAYLGAAMLAADEGRAEEVEKGIAKAFSVLDQAKETARQFREKYPDVLLTRKNSMRLMEYVKSEEALTIDNSDSLFKQGDASLNKAIEQFESGQLGPSQQSAGNAKSSYTEVMRILLPILADKTGTAISDAAGHDAAKYAPQTFEQAKAEILEIERFIDGINPNPPANPMNGIILAKRSIEISNLAKPWRKEKNSFEKLFLSAHNDRLAIAKALGIATGSEYEASNITVKELVDAITSLKNKLAAEEEKNKIEIARLEQKYKKQLEENVAHQRSRLVSEQNTQLKNLKEAFRAKLERETFETKRQKQVRSLFKKGEVELLVNMDGSLLIRLSSLQFASGSSKVEPKYFKLLGKVKQALDIYGDRKIAIEGHTDSVGDVRVNQKISLKRAESVRDFLIAAAMDGSRLKALGYGEVRPIASNEFAKGRAMNRRIDIIIKPHHD